MRFTCCFFTLLAVLATNAAQANWLDDLTHVAQPGTLTITVLAVESSGTTGDGHDSGCKVSYRLYNGTKYHVDNAVIRLGNSRLAVGEMVANTGNPDEYYTFSYDNGGLCSEDATWLQQHTSQAAALDCSMRGLAEGDCQQLVHGTSEISDDQIASLRASENRRLADAATQQRKSRDDARSAFGPPGQ